MYGTWPGLGAERLADGDLAVTTDFRNVLGEIVERGLANPSVASVFPGLTPQYLGLARPG